MKTEVIRRLHVDFEQRAQVDDRGMEFWLARDLMDLLGYGRWENFSQVLDRARAACTNSGHAVTDHFRDVTKMVAIGSGVERPIDDVLLTRYACYLVAQNGDPRKLEIAFAQTYFAVQTRRQEIIEQRLAERERLGARKKLTLSEKELSDLIAQRISDETSFGRIRSKGDAALFGGLPTAEMKQRLGVPPARPLADFLPTITIKAKDFAMEITNFTVRKANLDTEPAIADEHVKNNTDVRKLLTDRNIVPERLPVAEDIQKVARRLGSEERLLPGGRKPKPKRSKTDGQA